MQDTSRHGNLKTSRAIQVQAVSLQPPPHARPQALPPVPSHRNPVALAVPHSPQLPRPRPELTLGSYCALYSGSSLNVPSQAASAAPSAAVLQATHRRALVSYSASSIQHPSAHMPAAQAAAPAAPPAPPAQHHRLQVQSNQQRSKAPAAAGNSASSPLSRLHPSSEYCTARSKPSTATHGQPAPAPALQLAPLTRPPSRCAPGTPCHGLKCLLDCCRLHWWACCNCSQKHCRVQCDGALPVDCFNARVCSLCLISTAGLIKSLDTATGLNQAGCCEQVNTHCSRRSRTP